MMDRLHWTWALCALVVLGAALGGAPTAAAEEETAAAEEAAASLYDRLGGVYPIALVVDDFIDRVVVSETLNANPNVGPSREPKRYPGLKYHVTAMVCEVTGGPCKYTGKNMKDAHDGMEITAEEWTELGELFKASLDKFGVGETEQDELFAIVETTRGDIVVE